MSKSQIFSKSFEKLKSKDFQNYELKNSDPITIFYEKNEALKPLILNDELEENKYLEYLSYKSEKQTKNKNELKCNNSNIILISERSCPDELNLEKNINILEKVITKEETYVKNDLDEI
jgi:hypothetical protein